MFNVDIQSLMHINIMQIKEKKQHEPTKNDLPFQYTKWGGVIR
jgi:hypothetical protein